MPTIRKQHRLIFRALQFIFLNTWRRWISGHKIHVLCIGSRGKNSKTRYQICPLFAAATKNNIIKEKFVQKNCKLVFPLGRRGMIKCFGRIWFAQEGQKETDSPFHKCHCNWEVGKAISFVWTPFHMTAAVEASNLIYGNMAILFKHLFTWLLHQGQQIGSSVRILSCWGCHGCLVESRAVLEVMMLNAHDVSKFSPTARPPAN